VRRNSFKNPEFLGPNPNVAHKKGGIHLKYSPRHPQRPLRNLKPQKGGKKSKPGGTPTRRSKELKKEFSPQNTLKGHKKSGKREKSLGPKKSC